MTGNPETKNPVIELDHVRFETGGRTLLNISRMTLAARPGVSTVVLGPNGAGKTTLLNCLSGYNRITSGSMTLVSDRAYRLALMSPHAIVRAGLTRSFQASPPYPSIRVRDVLMLALAHGRTFAKKPGATAAKALASIADRLQIGFTLNSPCAGFDLATTRRIELARCLLSRPRCVLLDEPTAGLSTTERTWWFETLAGSFAELALIANGDAGREASPLSIGLITHDVDLLNHLSKLSDEPDAILLRDGQLASSGKLSRVMEEYLDRH